MEIRNKIKDRQTLPPPTQQREAQPPPQHTVKDSKPPLPHTHSKGRRAKDKPTKIKGGGNTQ